jgi:hypothetical protein
VLCVPSGHQGEQGEVGESRASWKLNMSEVADNTLDWVWKSSEVLVVKLKADPSWKMGEPRRIVLDSADTVPFASVRAHCPQSEA